MAYVIGVSSGMFMTAEQAEKMQYVTIPQKMFYGAFKGVNFTQIDLESITEFNEPYLQEGIRKLKEMGMRIALHGESYAMGGGEKPMGMLDSAIETEYLHAHQRLIQHIKGGGKIGAEFINIHPSETTPFIRLPMHLTTSRLVDPWGRPFDMFLEENKDLLDWALSKRFIYEMIFRYYGGADLLETWVKERVEEAERIRGSALSEEEKKKIIENTRRDMERHLKRYMTSGELSYGPERVAYFIIAKWMQKNRDPLWMNIVGKIIPDDDLPKLAVQGPGKSWVPAVSSKYVWGHFNPRDARFEDPKKLLEKYKMYFVFETQMGGGGLEGLNRLVRPRDMALLCQAIGTKWVGVCFDFEHVLAQNIDPKKEIDSFSGNLGKWLKVCHLGYPSPHAPGHIPLRLGSQEQYYLYERLFDLRQKGFKNGYLIFERGGGKDPIYHSVHVMRKIKHFLEENVPPDKLPSEFFGLADTESLFKRQEVAIEDHKLDPLKGLLAVPEEEYTFLSKTAAEKGKGKEWEKEKHR